MVTVEASSEGEANVGDPTPHYCVDPAIWALTTSIVLPIGSYIFPGAVVPAVGSTDL